MKGAFTTALIFISTCAMAQQNAKLDSVSPIVNFFHDSSGKDKSFGGLKAEDNLHFVGPLSTMNEQDEIAPGKFTYKPPSQNEWREFLFPLLSEGLNQFMITHDKTDGDRNTPTKK